MYRCVNSNDYNYNSTYNNIMNVNKSLVIATGYRSRFVNIDDILNNRQFTYVDNSQELKKHNIAPINSEPEEISVSDFAPVDCTSEEIGEKKISDVIKFDVDNDPFVINDDSEAIHPDFTTGIVEENGTYYIYLLKNVTTEDDTLDSLVAYEVIDKILVGDGTVYKIQEDGGTMWYTINYINGELTYLPVRVERSVKFYNPIATPGLLNTVTYRTSNAELKPFVYNKIILGEGQNNYTLNVDSNYELYRYECIVGRITINDDNVNVSFTTSANDTNSIYIPVNTVELESGHTYEYNIFDGCCNIIDVTPFIS